MDNEVLEILKLMQNDMKSMQNDMKLMQSDIKVVNNKLEKVENKTDKNTLLLENSNKKLEIIAEVQMSFTEQLDRAIGENWAEIVELKAVK